MDFNTNLSSSFVDMSCYSNDLAKDKNLNTNTKHNYIIENFLQDDDNISERIYNLGEDRKLITERPHIQKANEVTFCSEDKTVEYTFECSKTLESEYDFTLYFFSEDIISLNDLLKIQIFSIPSMLEKEDKNEILLEEISREFLACWFRLFKQCKIKNELFLPIFLNRYKQYYYNLKKFEKGTRSQLIFKCLFKVNNTSTLIKEKFKNVVYLYYKTQLFSHNFLKHRLKIHKIKNYPLYSLSRQLLL